MTKREDLKRECVKNLLNTLAFCGNINLIFQDFQDENKIKFTNTEKLEILQCVADEMVQN